MVKNVSSCRPAKTKKKSTKNEKSDKKTNKKSKHIDEKTAKKPQTGYKKIALKLSAILDVSLV